MNFERQGRGVRWGGPLRQEPLTGTLGSPSWRPQTLSASHTSQVSGAGEPLPRANGPSRAPSPLRLRRH